ncbi:hypothetical protein M9434_004548 [Picochlorum sp. BPE23]|nr:hypothetical protein M9434_004548 [Picochlorum sp. BPE23]
MRVPKILISNDDGVSAPGLQALVKEFIDQSFCKVFVCGPFGERSAQSNAISVTKHVHAFEIQVNGAEEAFAVDGTPADSIIVALRSQLLSTKDFDLVISGINRGDNAGVHVVYSGTVGAAREAAHHGYPALAFSIDNYAARSVEQYKVAAEYAVALTKEVLHIHEGVNSRVPKELHRIVLNVNIPGVDDGTVIQGFRLCRQGRHCSTSDLIEAESEPDFAEQNAHKDSEIHMGRVTIRAFKHVNFRHIQDGTPGTDHHALSQGFVSVTILDSLMDVPLNEENALRRHDGNLADTVRDIINRAGLAMGHDNEHSP